MTSLGSSATSVSMETVERLHKLSTAFHVFIYFCPEGGKSYAADGIEGWGGYFASRTAAMGPLPTEMVQATFYNFSPDVVAPAMDGVWDRVTAEQMQLARWRAVADVFDATSRDALSEADLDEAIAGFQRCVDGLAWDGRPLAAGNKAVLVDLDASDYKDDKLVRLWQLATIIREWRGDAHIALLVTEPLSGVECTVISHAQKGGFTKASRGWPEGQWNAAVDRLTREGWISDEETLTPEGVARRAELEDKTNQLAAPMWAGFTDDEVNRLGDLLQPLVDALAEAGHLKPIGIRPKG